VPEAAGFAAVAAVQAVTIVVAAVAAPGAAGFVLEDDAESAALAKLILSKYSTSEGFSC